MSEEEILSPRNSRLPKPSHAMLPKNFRVLKSETPELTVRQRDVLSFVLRQWSGGCPPTFRMIGDALAIGSPNAVSGHVKALRKKGYIRSDRATRSCVAPDERSIDLALVAMTRYENPKS